MHITGHQWAEWHFHRIGGSETTVSPVTDLLDVAQMTDIHLLGFISYLGWMTLQCGSGVAV